MSLKSIVLFLVVLPVVLSAQVMLTTPTSPPTAEPGTTLVTVTGGNFPTGSILPSQVNVRLEPPPAGVGPTVTTTAVGVQTVVGTTRRVTFMVPATLVVGTSTVYNVSVSGSTTTGTTFNSSNFAGLTIQPIPGILSSVPSAIQPGQAVAMLIRTQQGNFVQGATNALLGPGISVGVTPIGTQAPATDAFGLAGRVLVVDSNTLLAVVRAADTASAGTRELGLRQGATTYRKTDALSVQTGSAAITTTVLASISSPTSPDTGTPGTTTFTLTVSGLPGGTVQASQLRLFLEPALDSTMNPTFTVTPTSIGADTNGQRSVTFQVPSTLSFIVQTDYLITLYGSTSNYGQLSTGVTILSSNRALVSLGPPEAPAPLLINLNPTAGLQGQVLSIAIAGQNTSFVQGQTVAAFGAGISVGGGATGQYGPITVVSPTQATAQIQIQPGAALGERDIDVRTGTKSANRRGAFQVLQGATSISVSGIQPSTARPGTQVLLSGSGFPAGSLMARNVTVLLSPNRTGAGPSRILTAASVSADNAGARQIAFSIPADLVFSQPEAYLVSVSGTGPSGAAFSTPVPGSITIQPFAKLMSVVPNSGQKGQTLSVAIQGEFTSFQAGTTRVELGPGISVNSVSVASATTLTASVTIASNAVAGARNPVVTSGSETASLPNGFTVSGAPVPLSLNGTTTPASVRAGEQVTVQTASFPLGDVLPAQVTVTLEPAGGGAALAVIPVAIQDNGNNVRLIRFLVPASLNVTAATSYLVSISGANAAGVAFTSGNKSAVTIQPPAPVPSLSSISPNQGVQGQTLTVAVTGQSTAFSAGSTQLSLGNGIAVNSVAVNSGTSLTAQIAIASLASTGVRSVVVSTGTQTVTLANAFSVAPAAPLITAVSPIQGNAGQTLSVSVTGQNTHFAAGSTQVSFGTGITVSNIAVQNPLNLTVQLTIAANAVVGSRMITVTTGSEIATSASSFVVAAGIPSISSLNPSSGVIGQTLTVYISGQNTNFLQGPTQVSFGLGTTVSNVTVLSATSLTAQLTLDATATPGGRQVLVTTGAESAVLPDGFQVVAQTSSPTISSASPQLGAVGTTFRYSVVGSGTAFDQSQTALTLGQGVSVSRLAVTNATRLDVDLTVAQDAQPGRRNLVITTNGQTVGLENALGITGPVLSISNPGNLTFVNTPSITVAGSVGVPNASITVNDVPAPNVNGAFTVGIPLSEGTNTVTAVARTTAGAVSTTSINLTLDTTPPRVTILTPASALDTGESTITVTGIINDLVTGTVNDSEAQVSVNGVKAAVSNRTFSAAVPLVLGENTIRAVGRDRVGNAATASVIVNRRQTSQIKILSGNNQFGPISALLAAPAVVELHEPSGAVSPNRKVIFRVAGNDGWIADTSTGTPKSSLMLTSDAQGRAQVYWTLGSRAGAGNNSLDVTSPGIVDAVQFTATGTSVGASKIIVDSGLNQSGAVGDVLPLPFITVVTDAGNNRLSGVPVSFSVKRGQGTINGQSTATVLTDSGGRALVFLRLGPEDGIENHAVEATFSGNPGIPATFTATGRVARDPANTQVSGVVLDNSNLPLAGVTIRLLRLNSGTNSNLPVQVGASVVTDAQGQFVMRSAPVGVFKLMADGTTVGGFKRYPTLEFDLTTVAGRDNTAGMPIYLPVLDSQNQLCVTATSGGKLILPQVPGFSLSVAPGSATFPGGSRTGCISVTPVNMDKIPMMPGFGQQPRFVVTIQPVGTTFNPPAALTIPNVDGLRPRAVTELYSYDHDLASFVAIGSATVSDDGSLIRSDPGVGVVKAGWHCGGDPTNPAITGALRLTLSTSKTIKLEPRKGVQTFKISAYGEPRLDAHYEWRLVKKGSLSVIPAKFKESDSIEWLNACPGADGGHCDATLQAEIAGAAVLEVRFICDTTGESVVQTLQVMTDDALILNFEGANLLDDKPDLADLEYARGLPGKIAAWTIQGSTHLWQLNSAGQIINDNEWDDARNTYKIMVGYSAGGHTALIAPFQVKRVIAVDPINALLVLRGTRLQGGYSFGSPNSDVRNFFQRRDTLDQGHVTSGRNVDATSLCPDDRCHLSIKAATFSQIRCLIKEVLDGTPCRL